MEGSSHFFILGCGGGARASSRLNLRALSWEYIIVFRHLSVVIGNNT